MTTEEYLVARKSKNWKFNRVVDNTGEEITKRLNEKYKPILLARRVQKDANK